MTLLSLSCHGYHTKKYRFCCESCITCISHTVGVYRCGTTTGLRQRTYNSSSVTRWQVAADNTAVIDVRDCLLTYSFHFIQLLTITVTLIMGCR